ncbi:aspartic peptidase domain-containing protein [Gymnopilus junonius]|uniref:Aspartic peptidase domain-containing protein n=1 Tax=Gymnopilus junonius TaxID=109634 RepID=A0A9P5NDZ7_GYMJU|nr:aspartic peptidase domain-containing protein [Gymnopilus junonius]
MSTVVINAVPFRTHLKQGAQRLLAHDKARAAKFLQGLHPHGPVGSIAATASTHPHHHHHHHRKPRHAAAGGDAETAPATAEPAPVPPAGDPQAADDSIDVTDAGVTYTTSGWRWNNSWVGAGTKYKQTQTSKSIATLSYNVTYGSGSFSGTEFTDQVTLGSGLVIQNQSIGVAQRASGFSDVDGILGIGPVDLTEGTVSNTTTVPTVTDNLFAQGTIPQEIRNGELTFGGVDDTKITGDVSFVPITSTSPASNYWGIDQTVSYGDSSEAILQSSGIVDTGTTLLLIATDAFQAYQKATGAKLDITEQQFENLQSLFFNIGGTTFEFTPNAQIWPRSQNAALDGFVWLQRFYSVFDTTNTQVGIATTSVHRCHH